MRAAIDCLAALPNKKILVIGDMAELGDEAIGEHTHIGVYAKRKEINCLYGVGSLSAHAVAGFGQGAISFDNHQAVIDHLKNETQPFTVLVKGSRSAHMEVVVHALLKAEES
jgi:UDP-N-acetylmuramoyl-tripeptide--D-alanyl-D-alanine ligase